MRKGVAFVASAAAPAFPALPNAAGAFGTRQHRRRTRPVDRVQFLRVAMGDLDIDLPDFVDAELLDADERELAVESALAGDPCSDPLTNQIYIVYMFIIIIDI